MKVIFVPAASKKARPFDPRLAAYFRRNGYVRRFNPKRRKKEKLTYKKGNEVRLVAENRIELMEIRRLLRQAGFKVARPFEKARQWRQPVYGIAAVTRFLALVEAAPESQEHG